MSSSVQVFHGGEHGHNPMANLMRLDSHSDFERIAATQLAFRGFRQDAGATMAFARQLEHIFAKVYEAEFAEYKAYRLFPMNTEVDSGAMTFTYRMVQRIGNAALINSSNAKDLPKIDVGAKEWPSPVITLGASYDFSVINQASAAMAQIAIEAEKAKATREAIEQLEEQIACTGYPSAGVSGVTNAPGVVQVAQSSTGTWSAQLQTANATAPATTTPYPSVGAVSAIANDINKMKQQIYNSTYGRHKATNCLLPPNLYSMLDTSAQSPAFLAKTLLGFLRELTGLEFDDWAVLQTAGSINGSGSSVGSSDAFKTRVVVYEKNPEVAQLVVAQPFVQLAPQPTGLVWEIPCYSRVGGALCIRPLGICYMDGL